jgi:hypothetical protein
MSLLASRHVPFGRVKSKEVDELIADRSGGIMSIELPEMPVTMYSALPVSK